MNKTFFRCMAAAWAVIMSASLTAQAAPAQNLYGLSFYGNQLISVDPSSGDSIVVGTIATNLNGYGLASQNGLLYAFSGNSDLLFEINPTNAAINRSIRIGVTNLVGEGDLAFRADGTGFLATAFTSRTNLNATNGLYTFNMVAGTSQFVGTTPVAIDAMAFDSSNTLYALGQDDTNLYIVNPTNGSMTVVGSLGVALASPYAGMGFSADGTLYAAINDNLYTIDKTTGTATAVGTNAYFGYDSISGLTFVPQYMSFFSAQVSLGYNNFYLNGTNGGFGYYSLAYYPTVYHYELGFEYFIDAGDGMSGAYLYDFSSGTFFYTTPNLFPYVYDFSLNSFLYYYPDTNRPGRYTTNPRYFYDFNTQTIITK